MKLAWVVVAVAACGDSAPRVIKGTLIAHHVIDTGVVDVPVNLSAMNIAALVPPEMTAVPGAGRADGTFDVANVPDGEVYVQLGARYIVTDEDTLELSFDDLGRPDAEPLAAGSRIALSLAGLAPWQDGDELQIYVPNTGTYGPHVESDTSGSPPLIGATSLTDHAYTLQLAKPRVRFDAGAGDQVFVAHLAKAGSEPYRRVVGATTLAPFSLMQGGSVAVSGSLVAVPAQASLSVTWNRPAFELAAVGVIDPGDHLQYSQLAVHALLDASTRGIYGNSVDVLVWDPGYDYGSRPVTAAWPYGDPYPSEWTRIVTARFDYPDKVYSNGTEVNVFRGVRADHALDGLGGSLEPVIGSVQDLKLEGMLGLTVAEIKASPTLTWIAPQVGTVAHYEVQIGLLDINTQSRTQVASIETTKTAVTIPAGILMRGGTYVFRVTALAKPTLPTGYAYVETGVHKCCAD